MLKAHNTGIALGTFAALMHTIWSLLVFFGWAEGVAAFFHRMHFLEVPHTVLPFSIVTAVELVVLAGVVGYVVGCVFASVWNWTHR